MPSASKSSSKLPTASKIVNSTKPSTLNKGARKPSTIGVNQPAAFEQQPQRRLPDIIQASREDLLNLKAVIQSGTKDNDSQTSSSSRTEEDETELNAVNHGDTSEFNTIFWAIDVVKDLPIWAEPITMLTDHLFGVFDPAANEDVLVLLGAVDRLLPG